MREAVVAQVIAEWPLRFILSRPHLAGNHKICVGGNTVPVVIITIAEPPAAEYSCKCCLRNAFGQGHYCGQRMRWRAAHKHTHLHRHSLSIPLVLMDAYAAM